jgi:ribonuclease HII
MKPRSTALPPLLLCGVDEVGRGPLAGPVVTAAVILDPDNPIEGLADSKKLTEKRRECLYDEIRDKALCWHVARAEVHEIDSLNILHATMLAMTRAVEGLATPPQEILIDGNRVPKPLQGRATAVVGGDDLHPCISAASILAKVTRDREMMDMEAEYPGYGFDRHKGYPTRVHLSALDLLGITPIHRRSFGPVKQRLQQRNLF